jgi:hypothetical protein
MTAALLIGRTGVSAGTSGILLAARSEKKAWISAFDSQVASISRNVSSSSFRPSSKFIVTLASTKSTHLSGAAKFFEAALTLLRSSWK